MVLKSDDFTEAAQEILGTSQEIMRRYKHGQWDTEHILMALLELDEGVPSDILSMLGISTTDMRARLGILLEQGPKVTYESPQIYVSPRATSALERAKAEAERLNDEFIGIEHLLIAVVQDNQGDASKVMAEFKVDLEKVYQALQEVRGGHRVTDRLAAQPASLFLHIAAPPSSGLTQNDYN